MQCRLALAITLMLTLAVPSIAQTPPQEPPDLSGTWVLRPTKAPGPLGGHSRKIVIACSKNDVEMRSITDDKESLVRYTADGKSRAVQEGFWQELESTAVEARWEGSSLVIQKTLSTPFLELSRSTERWTISPDHRTLTQSWDGIKALNFVYSKE